MKKNKFSFSVAVFTLLTIFVFPLFMGMVSLQSLSMGFGKSPWFFLTKEKIEKEMEWRKEEQNKREKARKMKLKKIEKQRKITETNTLIAFEKSTSYSNHKKRYWLSPILLGLKEVTDKEGKTYKLDKITKALKKIPTKVEWKYWRATETVPLHWHLSVSDLLHPGHHFFDIKGEGRKQLLSLLEKGTGKPLGIVTKIKEKITEYQIKFFESIRPELMKLKNSIWSPSRNSVLKVTAGVQAFHLHYLMETKNLETVSYKNLDKWTKSQLIGISIRTNGLDGGVEAFRDGVATALKLASQALEKAQKKKLEQRMFISVNKRKNVLKKWILKLQFGLKAFADQASNDKAKEKPVVIVKTLSNVKPVLTENIKVIKRKGIDNKENIKIIGSNYQYQIDSLSEKANIESINSKTLFDNLQIPFSKNINNNEYQINKTEIKKKNPNPKNSLPKTTFSLEKNKLKKSNSTSRELQEHNFSLDKDKLKESLLQIKEIQIQPKITSVKNSLPKKTLNNKKIKQTPQTPSKVTLTENWKSKSVKKPKSTTLQNKREKTKLIIALFATVIILTFSGISACLYWFLKDKKIIFVFSSFSNRR